MFVEGVSARCFTKPRFPDVGGRKRKLAANLAALDSNGLPQARLAATHQIACDQYGTKQPADDHASIAGTPDEFAAKGLPDDRHIQCEMAAAAIGAIKSYAKTSASRVRRGTAIALGL